MGEESKALEDASDQGDPTKRANEPAPIPHPIPENHTPNANPGADSGKGEKTQANPFDRAMLRWTSVVGIFTAVLAFVGVIQTWGFIHGERAALYINIEQISPLPLPSDKPFSIGITIVNIGRSQGFITEGKAKVWVGQELPEKPSFADVHFSIRGAAPAQAKRFSWFGPLNPSLNWAQVEDIERGTQKLFIFGYIKYIDDFSLFGPRIVGFCGLYEPHGKTSTPGPAIEECKNSNYVYD